MVIKYNIKNSREKTIILIIEPFHFDFEIHKNCVFTVEIEAINENKLLSMDRIFINYENDGIIFMIDPMDISYILKIYDEQNCIFEFEY